MPDADSGLLDWSQFLIPESLSCGGIRVVGKPNSLALQQCPGGHLVVWAAGRESVEPVGDAPIAMDDTPVVGDRPTAVAQVIAGGLVGLRIAGSRCSSSSMYVRLASVLEAAHVLKRCAEQEHFDGHVLGQVGV
jgi:hypothetical protein